MRWPTFWKHKPRRAADEALIGSIPIALDFYTPGPEVDIVVRQFLQLADMGPDAADAMMQRLAERQGAAPHPPSGGPASDPAPEPPSGVVVNAAAFVRLAQDSTGLDLDYSEESIVKLDELLAHFSQLLDTLPAWLPNVLIEGGTCYLLEVARRRHGGEYRLCTHTETPALALLVTGDGFTAALLGHHKIAGRLSGDPADNVSFYYQGLGEAIAARRSVLLL